MKGEIERSENFHGLIDLSQSGIEFIRDKIKKKIQMQLDALKEIDPLK